MPAIIVLLSLASIGYGQVNNKYTFTYDLSGNRISRIQNILTTQEIDLRTGWNIFSANVLSENSDLLSVDAANNRYFDKSTGRG